ncbi:PEP-utilizing enzyme [Bacillus sp. FJAT-29814]|uniref:PEP-utilizing enzyme n=1 Tax=Bacillus sp. FJAT-29814 TaxID=1729688 RepID=UPI00082A9500|nr:PEP-utilizing enzyme [Bacillus sp. FJAT-29814]
MSKAIPFSDWKQNLFLSENDKQQEFWMLDDTHFSGPLTPLYASFLLPAVSIGTKRAFENMKMPISQFLVKLDHGYYYQAMPPHPEPFEERIIKHQNKMEEYFPRVKSYLESKVNEFYMPFYRLLSERSIGELSLNQALENVKELQDFYLKAWECHFEITIPRTALAVVLEEAYGQVTGKGDTKEVYDLLQGVMNMSLETDRGLWLLANQVKASEFLSSSLTNSLDSFKTLEQTGEGREFLEELMDFLSIYGHRKSATHEFAEETWFENPAYALSIIKKYVLKDYHFDLEFQQLVAERQEKVGALFKLLPDSELTDRFKTLYNWALSCWGVDEDHHFYIDAMIAAKSRYFLKNVGRTLVRYRVITAEEDIFYLFLDDLLEVLQEPKALHELVGQNKNRMKEYKKRKPEPFFGTQSNLPADPVIERIFGLLPNVPGEKAKSFKGNAASAGIYSGKVKVITGQEDFSKLNKGDILVCKTTAPSWTVLFPIAGALITDAGGILAHASIIAREYRLPAVVGTKVATTLLKDGDLVTVDGKDGIVYLE